MVEINFNFKYEKREVLDVFDQSTNRGHYGVIFVSFLHSNSKIMASE